MTQQQTTTVKVGTEGFGTLGGYPPARWRFDGKRAGAWVLSHVKHPSQSVRYPDQYVTWGDVVRICTVGAR